MSPIILNENTRGFANPRRCGYRCATPPRLTASHYLPQKPGDLVPVDTVSLHPLPGVILQQFAARDVVSRWDVIEVHRPATSLVSSAACACWSRHPPQLNGRVEHVQRTHTEEFYAVTPCSLQIPALNQELLVWERTYNTVCPWRKGMWVLGKNPTISCG